MKIIYLSQNMSEYSSASYQQEIMNEMARQHQVFFYGPGFPTYDQRDGISKIIAKSTFQKPDLLCIGHSWLIDSPYKDLLFHRPLNLPKLDIPKAMILNKEYSKLEEKLNYIVENRIDVVFTHHHKAEFYSSKTGTNFVFWPFAVNQNRFFDRGLFRKYDLSFTGLLRNVTYPYKQSDFRTRVQRKLFRCYGELRLFKRQKYRNCNIYWQAQPAEKKLMSLNRLLHGYRRLKDEEYVKLLNTSRICLNGLSPLDLVTTRYFESMATKCLVLCEESHVYDGLFENEKHCVMVSQDLSDFDEKLFFYIENENARTKIVEQANHHINSHHTWKHRLNQFTEIVKRLI